MSDAKGERLQKVLAGAGVASRRKSEDLISSGKVTVNGTRAELGMRVSPNDEVRVSGELVERKKTQDDVTYAFYKPVGVLSSSSDDRGRKTVIDFLPEVPGLHPVGRLDLESEGLLLMTTDGDLTLQLTHPRYEHEKEYRVWCDKAVPGEVLRRLEQGVNLKDGPAKAIRAHRAEGGCVLVLGEGRNHQVRRMLAAFRLNVTRLKRTRVSGLRLEGLKSGEYRLLEAKDLARLGYTRGHGKRSNSKSAIKSDTKRSGKSGAKTSEDKRSNRADNRSDSKPSGKKSPDKVRRKP